MTAWWSWMSAMSVQVLVVVGVVAILERVLARRVRPRLAAALWTVALLKLVVPPTVGSPVSVARLLPTEGAASAPAFVAAAFWIWLGGVALLGLLAIRRHLSLRRDLLGRIVARRSRSVFEVRGLAVPCVLGFFKPIVLLPEGGASTHALLHEITHVRRRDPLKGLFALLVHLVYWFHPAAWIIRTRLAALREIGCDADAARSLGPRSPEYRRMLLDVARGMLAPPARGVTALLAGRSRVVERLEWLKPGAPASRAGMILAPLAAALVLSACVPLARPVVAPFAWPTLEEARGCLQRQYVVLAALAKETGEESK
jgi:beta-lactamase regulating signal transducer with metallopeptidase domain